ncbi:YHYH domain-containing protein [Azohydromonas australica]|uniref:YHYH domain-containing protein n=1 Tax=Azohydromonas australica TaxID=364039 RepID=UPI0035C16F95
MHGGLHGWLRLGRPPRRRQSWDTTVRASGGGGRARPTSQGQRRHPAACRRDATAPRAPTALAPQGHDGVGWLRAEGPLAAPPAGASRTLGMEDGRGRMMKCLPLLAVAGLAAVSSHAHARAHGGGLDAEGCHHDRKTGDYHCHRAQAAPSPPPTSQASGTQTVRGTEPMPASPGSAACHVGPRGGTYTITSSGRKNYAGC